MERERIIAGLGRIMEESATEDVDWSTVTEVTSFDSFGLDSLAVLDLIFDLEQEFGVEIEAEEMMGMKTIGDLVTFLDQRTKSDGS